MRVLMRVSAVIALALLVCGCGNSGSGGGDVAGGEEIEVRLGYFANITHAQAVLGVANGEFATALAPANLTTRVFNAGPSLVEALFAGEIDLAYVGPGPALSAFEKSHGEGVVVLAGAAANGVVIVARKDAGIASMRDLAGKRIATPQMGNTQDIAARHYMMKDLGQSNADNVMPIPNSEQLAMMERGQIDAAWAPEPWGARLINESGAVLLAEEKDFWPSKEFLLTVVAGRPEFVAKHPEVVEKFLRAHVQLTNRLQVDAQQLVSALQAAMLQLTGKRLDEPTLRQAMARVKFTDQPAAETFEVMSGWALDLGFSREKPELARLIDASILTRVKTDALAGETAGSEANP